MELNIDIKKVTPTGYRSTILSNISLKINKPGIVWIQGENATGKSILSSIIAGKAFFKNSGLNIDGYVKFKNPKGKSYIANKMNGGREYAAEVSFLPQKLGTSLLAIHHQDDLCFPLEGRFPDLPGKTNRQKDKYAINTIENILNELNLWAHLTKKLGQCSYGESRRMEYACAISPHAKVVILDEPFGGLDPKWRNTVVETINKFPLITDSIWVITSHNPPEKYGIQTIEHIVLEAKPENQKNFLLISEFIEKHFTSCMLNNVNKVQIKDLLIERKKFNVRIELGRFIAEGSKINFIEGANGSGKSTILHFLAGLLNKSIFKKISVCGNIEGGPYDSWVIKTPTNKVRLLLQDPYRSFVHCTVKEDLYHKYSIYSSDIHGSDIFHKSFFEELVKNWGIFERKPSTFSFGQLKFLQLLLVPTSSEIILIDEPFLSLHPSLFDIMLSSLQAMAESGRIVIASVESDISAKIKYRDNYKFYKLPTAS